MLRRRFLLLLVVVTQLLLVPVRGWAAVPYGWPDGWSEADQLGSVSRYAPYLRAWPCWESQTLHIMWVGDGPGGPASALIYSRIDLNTASVAMPHQVVYQLRQSGTIDALDFVVSENMLHAVWVEQRGGTSVLVRGVFGISAQGLLMTSTNRILNTDHSILYPQVAAISGTTYIAWSDSREGSLDVYLLKETPEGDSRETIKVTSSATVSAHPFIFISAGVEYIGWIEQIGDVRRELRVRELNRAGDTVWTLRFTVGNPAVDPAAYVGNDSLDLLLTLRAAGRDNILFVRTSKWLAAAEPPAHDATEVGKSVLTSRGPIHDLGFLVPARSPDQLVFVFSRADTASRLGVWEATVHEDGTASTQELTPGIAGAFHPVMFEDARGNRHLLFLAVQPDMSYIVNYMNTVSPAKVSYWSLIGVDSDHVLTSFIGRFITVAALALATLLPNAMLLIAGGLLLFLAGARVGKAAAWIPGILLTGLTISWYYTPFAPLLYYGGHSPLQAEVLAAAVLACLGATVFLWLRRKQWQGELLTIVFIDCLWFYWFFLFTLLRS